MYLNFFGFDELPFSIVPNARYLYLSQRHQEAIVHLQAGLGDGGGFAMLTGEVGTGKTTVARAILASLPGKTRAGMILNPTFSDLELLEAICDEFEVSYPKKATLKKLTQVLHEFLLAEHAQGIQVLLMIDEAQHLAPDVLEQLRLLTNLETESHKLLKVLLIGQPELQEKLRLPQLRQLAQRITGRYHLLPLNEEQTADYIRFRIEQASGNPELFNRKACQWIAEQTHGIPRLINLVCDAALKQAYQAGEPTLSLARIKLACQEVMSFQSSVYQLASAKPPVPKISYLSSALGGIALAVVLAWQLPPSLIGLCNTIFRYLKWCRRPNREFSRKRYVVRYSTRRAASMPLKLCMRSGAIKPRCWSSFAKLKQMRCFGVKSIRAIGQRCKLTICPLYSL